MIRYIPRFRTNNPADYFLRIDEPQIRTWLGWYLVWPKGHMDEAFWLIPESWIKDWLALDPKQVLWQIGICDTEADRILEQGV